jgi:hypothetical protein
MWRSARLLCGLAAVGTLTLAACSSTLPSATSSGTSTTATTGSTATTSTTSGGQVATSTTSTGGSQAATTVPSIPSNVPNVDSVRANVSMPNCSASSGGWAAGGVVKNPSATDTTYNITVFFTNSVATVLDYAQTSVPVKAHGSELWSVKATFAAPSQVLCVLRGVSTS